MGGYIKLMKQKFIYYQIVNIVIRLTASPYIEDNTLFLQGFLCLNFSAIICAVVRIKSYCTNYPQSLPLTDVTHS